jgi:GR25 family glycosyltransferase involved in LPS biosynthesis
MDCYYINLDFEIQRKESLELNFAANKLDHWTLTRIPAVGTVYIEERNLNLTGRLSKSEKACILSHCKAISQPYDERPAMILEDDVHFGRHTCKIIEYMLNNTVLPEWDIIYTDVIVPNLNGMLSLVKLRRVLSQKSEFTFTLLQLNNHSFAGATAYILNSQTRPKLLSLIHDNKYFNIQVDLLLPTFIRQGELKSYVIFPSVTTVSEHSYISSIQPTDAVGADTIWNLFRELVWHERNLNEMEARMELVNKRLTDKEAKYFGQIVGFMFGAKFKTK